MLRETQIWKSIFRVDHSRSDNRSRALAVFSNVFLHIHPTRVNRGAVRLRYTWGMGGISFFLFLVLTVTGALLMFYYHPTKIQAYRDMLYLEHDVPFGRLLRNMHRWAGHLMVITVWLHMVRVMLTGAYRKPREFNWVVGVLLMVLTLLLSFTGYLLPDDQLGFWAVTVGTNMARAAPAIGNWLAFALLGGSTVDANALLRAYVWHCIGIPLLAIVFTVVHFWRVRKDGGISGPASALDDVTVQTPPDKRLKPPTVSTWPYLLRIEFLGAIVVMVVLLVWSLTMNAPLAAPADPNQTMNPAKAPWYFVGLQEMLVYFDPWFAGVVLPALIVLGLMLFPYLDVNPYGTGYYTFRQRRVAVIAFSVGLLIWFGAIIVGSFMRGPGWMWFWPGQSWDHTRVVYEVDRNLPGQPFVGMIAISAFYALGAWIIHTLIGRSEFERRIFDRTSRLQYVVFQTFAITILLAVPAKIVLRLLFRIKYVLVTPWFNL
jgi:quinol-cytochrome oxidoreductase complex cytochrome b subunit